MNLKRVRSPQGHYRLLQEPGFSFLPAKSTPHTTVYKNYELRSHSFQERNIKHQKSDTDRGHGGLR